MDAPTRFLPAMPVAGAVEVELRSCSSTVASHVC
jgi:hypothetical protein